MHFMYENDGSNGYIAKGAGTKPARSYNTTIYCVLNVKQLFRDGHDLFLTANGVVLISDDVSLEYIRIVRKFPYLGLPVFSNTVPHILPREVQNGSWREGLTLKQKYLEYLSSDEISEYLDPSGDLVEWWIPSTCKDKKRQTAWEFMGQQTPTTYNDCISSLFKGGVSSSSAPAEGFDTTQERPAEASSSSTPAEVFDVDAELSTKNNQEIQAVRIVSESAWHLWQSGILTLRSVEGLKVENQFYEVVTVLREFWRMSESQQNALLSEGVTRHVWERCPLAGHTVFFMTRAWEIGRMSGYVKNYSEVEEQSTFQRELQSNKAYGWLRDIPAPREPENDSPEAHNRYITEKEEFLKDEGEVRTFQLFAEGVEDLYTGLIDSFVRKTPALWEEFAMKLPDGSFYLVDPDPNICLDIHNNVKFSPRLCLWAIPRKLEITREVFVPGSFAELCFKELKKYVESRSDLTESFYKHLVINTQSRTFEDANYVNTIGSKVVLKPVGEIFEISVKKNKTLQRTMVQPKDEKDSSAMDESGDLPTGEMPEESMDVAEPTEDLPTGEISVEEAKQEDVEMEAQEQQEEEEEVPQDEQVQQEQEEEADYAESEVSSTTMERANQLVNTRFYEEVAGYGSEDDEVEVEQRPRIATPVMARFIKNFMREDLPRIDQQIAAENQRSQRQHEQQQGEEHHEPARAAGDLPTGEIPVAPGSSGDLPPGEIPDVPIEEEKKEEEPVADEEVFIYQEDLQGMKSIDIFAKAPTVEFMELLKPETEKQASSAQQNFENLFLEGNVVKTNRPFQNKIKIENKLDEPLEEEPTVKVSVPKPEPKGEDQSHEDYECALDGLRALDRQYGHKNFGFYGKYFRSTHGNSLNFVKYRKANPIAHPCAKFDIDEEKLVALYCELFYSTPTPEDFFYQKTITYTCEDHRLRLKDDEKMLERSNNARAEFDNKKEILKKKVKQATGEEMGYDDLVTDISELLLSGEAIDCSPESVGSSSKSLTTLFWNLGNWARGVNFRVPDGLDYQKLFFKESRPDRYPHHVQENNNLFLQMVKNFRGHLILNCEASTLLPHKEYLQNAGWSLCFNDANDLWFWPDWDMKVISNRL